MAATYTWGRWEEKWPNGRFQCIFVEAQPQRDGMISATGLYRATDGDVLQNMATYQDTILERAAILSDGGGTVLVKTDFAELLAIMPAFLQDLTEQLGAMSFGGTEYSLDTES